MKALGYTFAVLGAIAFVSLFFGYTHQILTVAICALMAHSLLTVDDTEENRR